MSTTQLGAVGDTSLSSENGNPLRAVNDELSTVDLLFGNLETVVQTPTASREKSVVIDVPKDAIGYLNEAGFDAVNVANNHILDNGVEGFRRTIESLEEYDIPYVGGAYELDEATSEILESNGVNIGFLGYTRGTNSASLRDGFNPDILRKNKDFLLGRDYTFNSPTKSPGVQINTIDENAIEQEIQRMNDRADVTVVSFHWGTENVHFPSPSQVELARNVIDHGADVVIGHHPHVLQGIEEYNNGLILYSLGNFQFSPDVSQSDSTRSALAKITLDTSGVQEYELVPIDIDERAIPRVTESQNAESLISFINRISTPIKNNAITYSWWFEQIGETHLQHNIRSYMRRIRRYGGTHFFEFLIWLLLPFTLRCYMGVVKKKIKSVFG